MVGIFIMILPTVYKYLQGHGTINDVFTRANSWANPGQLTAAYLVIWEDTSFANVSDNGEVRVKISCHVPPENDDDLDKYIVNELFTLLDKKVLTDGAFKIRLSVTAEMTDVSLNDDGTISRSRVITLASRWR